MKYFFLTLLLISCGHIKNKKKSNLEHSPWESNQILDWKEESMKLVFYEDTITLYGPLRFGCFHYNNGNDFFEESILLKKNESYSTFINRIEKARANYYKKCIECGDSNFWEGTKQNLEIITLHALIKLNELDSAINYLNNKSKKWKYSSNHNDLYLALLLKKNGRNKIENVLKEISNLNEQDSILIENYWIHWNLIKEYNYHLYQENINWEQYFTTTMNRIEKYGF